MVIAIVDVNSRPRASGPRSGAVVFIQREPRTAPFRRSLRGTGAAVFIIGTLASGQTTHHAISVRVRAQPRADHLLDPALRNALKKKRDEAAVPAV
jgi:hypothetical protein